MKALHRTIKKIANDTDRFSFNRAVSGFMVAVHEFTDLKCHKKEILEPLSKLFRQYAPHIAEELYRGLVNKDSILNARFPELIDEYLIESEKECVLSARQSAQEGNLCKK